MKATGKEDMDEDASLKRLYALTPDEAPPAALDRAILAQARSAVAANAASEGKPRKAAWGPPLAAAAVLMLGVAVTFTMQQERPEVLSATGSAQERMPVSPPAKSLDVAPVAPDKALAPREDRAPASTEVRRAPVASAEPGAAPALRDVAEARASSEASSAASSMASQAPPAVNERSERAPAGAGLPRDTAEAAAPVVEAQRRSSQQGISVGASAASAASAYAPQLGADREAPARASQPPARALAPSIVGPAVPRLAAPVPPPRPQAAPRATLRSDANAVTPLLAEANMTPEQWLARLAELKAQGRQAEFEQSLAAFRKRFPDHGIPEALLNAVIPQRQQ